MFAIQVEDAVSAMGSGVILKGSCDLTKYQIKQGTCLYDLAANEYIVSTVTMTEDSQVEILISDARGKPADYFTGRVLTTLADGLTELLQQVPNSYSDFVNMITKCATKHNLQYEIVKYIEKHPVATTSDVIEFYLDLEDSMNTSQNS